MADTKKAAAAASDFGDDSSVEVAAAAPTPTAAEMAIELERLRKQVADLQATASFQPAIGVQYIGDPHETFCGSGIVKDGKFVATDDGHDVYHYLIDLPPSGGSDIRLCGVPFYHGVGYYVDIHQLRTLREIVSRTWGHEASIRGSNENFYRNESAPIISGKHGRIR